MFSFKLFKHLPFALIKTRLTLNFFPSSPYFQFSKHPLHFRTLNPVTWCGQRHFPKSFLTQLRTPSWKLAYPFFNYFLPNLALVLLLCFALLCLLACSPGDIPIVANLARLAATMTQLLFLASVYGVEISISIFPLLSPTPPSESTEKALVMSCLRAPQASQATFFFWGDEEWSEDDRRVELGVGEWLILAVPSVTRRWKILSVSVAWGFEPFSAGIQRSDSTWPPIRVKISAQPFCRTDLWFRRLQLK